MEQLARQIAGISYREANTLIHGLCGVVDFFSSEEDKTRFLRDTIASGDLVCEDRASYGDWQTPPLLARSVCKEHIRKFGDPDVVIEPTCGIGAFVMASLDTFKNISELHAIEINSSYTRELKEAILRRALNSRQASVPDIFIYNADIFAFDLSGIIKRIENKGLNLAIIGNPPWVTNSRQGRYSSDNLPEKSNLHRLKGIDAITGKSNFDISEYITLSLISLSQNCHGGISFLLKNSVVRNLIYKQKGAPLHIADIEQKGINAAKEFNVAVGASCFTAHLGRQPHFTCSVCDFYTSTHEYDYGWVSDAFVANLDDYRRVCDYDGRSSYIWRSGVKHDCADILELEAVDGCMINGLGEKVDIENDLIYPLIKSSDINKPGEIPRKWIIMPQRHTGENTSSLKLLYPKTYGYLESKSEYFSRRKSSIYHNKDRFSIFGTGDYTFKPFKVVVSALYKNISFRLVKPVSGRPVIVDDTCYQLAFDTLDEAAAVLRALESDEMMSLIRSLVFNDAKRIITKTVLMRLDVQKYCRDKGLLPECRNECQLTLFD